MTKYEIIKYLYENNVRGDFTIEQMAEDLVDASQKEYKRGRLDALNELKAYIREMGTYDTADTPQTEMDKCYKCRWWNYSYGCQNKKGICEFEPMADRKTEQTEREGE